MIIILVFLLIVGYVYLHKRNDTHTPPPTSSTPISTPPKTTHQPPEKIVEEPVKSKAEQLGEDGEDQIAAILAEFNEANVFRNVYVPTTKGETSEVDVVAVNSKGILVFESKNYSGWIFGTDTDKMWTQTFSKVNKKQFKNPIHQNMTHIRHLSKFLSLEESHFHSVIVFGSHCTLRKITVVYHPAIVVSVNDLSSELLSYYQKQADCFSPEEVTFYSEKLRSCTHVSDEVKEKHIQYASRHQNKTSI